MNCQELAEKIQRLEPDASHVDIARYCLLISNAVDNLDEVHNDDHLKQLWNHVSLKVQAAADQHAAMTAELESLAHSDPTKFSRDQIWVLIRAIKVQSQVLQLYFNDVELDV